MYFLPYFVNLSKTNSMEEKQQKSTATKQTKIDLLLSDLKSNNNAKIKSALEGLKIVGEPNMLINIVVQLDSNGPSEKNTLILEFLSCLKDSRAKSVMIELIKQKELSKFQQLLLSTLWNSPLDYSEYLDSFVELAIEGDFMIALECLTILENLEGPFSEKSVMESQVLLGKYAENNPEKDSRKAILMSDIAMLIQGFQKQVDSED